MDQSLSPVAIAAHLKAELPRGSWSIFGWTVTGVPLAVVWLLEALILVGGPAGLGSTILSELPFCEACGRWTRLLQDVGRLSTQGTDRLIERIRRGDWRAILEHDPGAPGARWARANYAELLLLSCGEWLRLDLASCPGCAESRFVSIVKVTHVGNRESEPETREEPLIRNVPISPAQVEILARAGRPIVPAPKEPPPAKSGRRRPS
jgi:hypothetical protein